MITSNFGVQTNNFEMYQRAKQLQYTATIKSGAFLGLLLAFTLFITERKLLSDCFWLYYWPSPGISQIAIITLMNLNEIINYSDKKLKHMLHCALSTTQNLI